LKCEHFKKVTNPWEQKEEAKGHCWGFSRGCFHAADGSADGGKRMVPGEGSGGEDSAMRQGVGLGIWGNCRGGRSPGADAGPQKMLFAVINESCSNSSDFASQV
jgi:hypothetical protein